MPLYVIPDELLLKINPFNAKALEFGLGMMVILFVDFISLVFRVRRKIYKEFGKSKETKGIGWYAVSRALQMRRMRLPAPKVKIGGTPIPKKAA